MKKLFLFSFMLMSLFALAQTDFIQTDWSGGPGQTVFNDNTKFNSSFNVDYSSFPGDLIAQNNFKTHVYGVVEYQGKLLITTGWSGTYIYDPVTLEWEFSQIAVTINYQNNTIHDGLLYILQGRIIYRYDGSHNDYGMGPNGWELHSDITPLGLQTAWTIKSVQDKLLIGCRNYSYSARVIEWNESTQSWNIMGAPFTSGVCSLIEYNGVIYAGTHWSGLVYKWTGSSWIPAFGTSSMSIINMEVHNGDLYLAGGNDLSWGRLYKYNGNYLEAIATYYGHRVYDLESHGNVLAFTIQGNYNSSEVLQYDGSEVSVLYPYGGENTSAQLCSYQGDLYYGGIQGTSTSTMYKNGIEFETIYVKGVFSSEFPTANGLLNVEATTAEGNGVKIFVQGKNNSSYTASPWIEIPDGEAVPISDDIMRYWAILYTVGEGPGPTLHEISIGYETIEPLEITLISKTDINCNGDETGAIDIAVSGGVEPYSFIWSNGAITEDLDNIPAGSYSVIVTDADENVSTCDAIINIIGIIPSCQIDVELENDTYTGGDGLTIFMGYGPQALIAHVLAEGGGPFTYSWTGGNGFLSSTTSSDPIFTPTVDGMYTLICTVTNSYGCETICEVEICVMDIRAGGNGNNPKVYLCHVPKGNHNKAKTLRISVNAVPGHLNHHEEDHLGRCDQECGSFKVDFADEAFTEVYEPTLNVYPNPTLNLFNFILESPSDDIFSLEVYDHLGRKMMELDEQLPNETIEFGDDLPIGFYYINVVQGEFVQTLKIIKTH